MTRPTNDDKFVTQKECGSYNRAINRNLVVIILFVVGAIITLYKANASTNAILKDGFNEKMSAITDHINDTELTNVTEITTLKGEISRLIVVIDNTNSNLKRLEQEIKKLKEELQRSRSGK